MESASPTGAGAPVRYLLSSRLSPEGRAAITLKLYRGNRVAVTKAVAKVDLSDLAEVMRRCRQHLGSRGLQALSSDAAMSRARPARGMRDTPASRLPKT